MMHTVTSQFRVKCRDIRLYFWLTNELSLRKRSMVEKFDQKVIRIKQIVSIEEAALIDFGGGYLIAVPAILTILKNVTRKGLGPLARQ